MHRSNPIVAAFALSLLAVAACGSQEAATCRDKSPPSSAALKPTNPAPVVQSKQLTVDELASILDEKQRAPVAVLDANNPMTRGMYGVIPGATVLSHYRNYQVSELPPAKDTKLVFYCANPLCSAAGAAADRAIVAGYRDVNTLPAGIMGWTDAGKQVSML